MLSLATLPQRAGESPQTNPAMPHTQLSQNAGTDLQEELFARIAAP